MTTEFVPFPKIARLSREVVVTEKIDGTNAQVYVSEDGSVMAGSRTKWITPADDNHGFARWVHENAAELAKLGPGSHFGEWWGSGIQRGYGLARGEKRFSLFNVSRWGDEERSKGCTKCALVASTWAPEVCARCKTERPAEPPVRPACCSVVPVMWRGSFDNLDSAAIIAHLAAHGSRAAPGFMRPEGIVIFHVAGGYLFKKTIERDEEPKGKQAA